MHHTYTAETYVKGIPLSSGVALGRACFYRREVSDSEVTTVESLIHERHRLNLSLAWMTRRLETLAQETESRLGSDKADIFRTHRMILEDESLRQRLFEIIEITGLCAEDAVEKEFNRCKTQLQTADSRYLRQRVVDLMEIQQGLLEHLRQAAAFLRCQDMTHCNIGQCPLRNSNILIAEELTPSLPIEVDSHTVGFIVEKGGPNSHAAILARGLRLPVISGIRDLFATIPLEAQLLVNGNTGEIIINPSELTRLRAESTENYCNRELEIHNPISELKVMANIARAADAREALVAKADGIGLYRTEMEALAKGRLLGEAEQAALYTEVIQIMAEKPVYIRLLDLGADKAATWLGMPHESNPALGCRGTRLLLAHPKLLQTQARALARAAVDQPIHVVYPMIIDLEQFQRVRACFDAAVADLKPSNLRHGVLFEVPSACLQARQILREADFGCIGTNDLIQYLFAVDRMNEAVANDACADHPALWGIIEDLAMAGEEAGKPMSICGECASLPDLTRRVIKAGISAVSTTPKRIAEVRRAAAFGCGKA